MSITTAPARRLKRRRRARAKVRGTAQRPRISVFRSNRGMFLQLIDDDAGRTLAAVTWTEPELKGRDLELALGYSHAVPVKAPDGIEFEVPQPTRVIVKGNNKQQVGEIAAIIRKQRPPEPYKGKGIRYEGEYVPRKVGKRA